MIKLVLYLLVLTLGGALAFVIRRFQLRRLRTVEPYHPSPDDKLVELELSDESRQQLRESLPAPGPGKYRFLLPATEAGELGISGISVAPLRALERHLAMIRSDLEELREFLEAEELGKLMANLDYLTDFSDNLYSSLVLMYSRQLDPVRFGSCLENLDRQTAQILHAIELRTQSIREQIEDASQQSRAGADTLELAKKYFGLRHRYLLGVKIRCIAGYIRAILPASHRSFVTRQLMRLRDHYAKSKQRDRKVIEELRGLVSQSSDEGWLEKVTEAISGLVDTDSVPCEEVLKEVDALKSRDQKLIRDVQKLLRKPRAAVRQLCQKCKSDSTLIVELSGDNQLQSAWQMVS